MTEATKQRIAFWGTLAVLIVGAYLVAPSLSVWLHHASAVVKAG